jgi:oligoendopeptidase F
MATTLQQFRTDVELFREENVPLLAEEQATASRYGETIGSLTVDFDGQERTLAQLAPYRAEPNRALREAAWHAGHDAMLSVRSPLDDLFDELLALRRRIAANAGYDNYRDYKWRQLGRFDYTPDDAVRFQAAIRDAVVPALERQHERRAAALGLPALRPWDLDVDVHGDRPLRPFDTGDELSEGSIRIFDNVDRELGGMLRVMRDEGLLDLDNRKGKAPGGYCATLSARHRPFIFMNAVGTEDNVRTMLHEAGHAFHVFDRRPLPLIWQRRSPMEFSEVASMSMELLTSPYLARERGGFYEPEDAVRARIQHLERIIAFLPYMATVDAFQHWLYANPEHSRDERDEAWLGLHEAYNVGVDWSGFEEGRESLWHHKLHIFQVPFYYIEYGIAQLGALQVWRNSLTDPADALRRYRAALALGGTRPLPELFETAGARLAFDTETVAELVELVEGTIRSLETELTSLRAA